MSMMLLRTIALGVTSALLLSACDKTPPDFREMVTLPVYTQGDADNGALIFEDACAQCHQLTPGLNKKGPQLLNVYGAPAATLNDYNYSDGLKNSGWVWDAETLDPYIADSEKAIADSKMLADPMPNASERADVIAYLSTLRAPVPKLDEEGYPIEETEVQRTDEAVEVPPDAANTPAANFQ